MNIRTFWEVVIGKCTIIGCIISIIILFLILTYNGITTGNSQITLDSNMYGEHYLELLFISIGLVCYFRTRHIKIHLRKQ